MSCRSSMGFSLAVVFALILLVVHSNAFRGRGSMDRRKTTLVMSSSVRSRGRAQAGKAVGSIIVGAALFCNGVVNMPGGTQGGIEFGVRSATAAVGEGDLPDGIMAFQKLVKFQKDLDNVADSVKKRGSEMDNMEIQQLKIFMKQLANEYSDMEFLSRGINSEKDRDTAKSVGKSLREEAREVDKALSDGKTSILTDKYPAMKKQIADFFALLSDVPDEL